MSPEQTITEYEAIAATTSKMLAAARAADWETLADLERDCAARVAVLRAAEPLPQLSGELRLRKVRLLGAILADDAEIRDLTQPWLARLSTLISGTRAEAKLAKAYGSSPTN